MYWQSSSEWIRALAQSLIDRLEEKFKGLFRESDQLENSENDFITPLTLKLDKLMDVLKLNPFSKSGKLKKKLQSISHQDITPIHLICPQSLECEDFKCDPCGLHQATRERDIPIVTLIKGNKIYKKVADWQYYLENVLNVRQYIMLIMRVWTEAQIIHKGCI